MVVLPFIPVLDVMPPYDMRKPFHAFPTIFPQSCETNSGTEKLCFKAVYFICICVDRSLLVHDTHVLIDHVHMWQYWIGTKLLFYHLVFDHPKFQIAELTTNMHIGV